MREALQRTRAIRGHEPSERDAAGDLLNPERLEGALRPGRGREDEGLGGRRAGGDEDGEGDGVFTPEDKGEADLAWIAYIVAEK